MAKYCIGTFLSGFLGEGSGKLSFEKKKEKGQEVLNSNRR